MYVIYLSEMASDNFSYIHTALSFIIIIVIIIIIIIIIIMNNFNPSSYEPFFLLPH